MINVLQHNAFASNNLSTKFCDEHTDDIINRIQHSKDQIDESIPIIALALFTLKTLDNNAKKSIWEEIGYWREVMRMSFVIGKKDAMLELEEIKANNYSFNYNNNKFIAKLIARNEDSVEFKIGEHSYCASISTDNHGNSFVSIDGSLFSLQRNDLLMSGDKFFESHSISEGSLFAPTPGKIIKVNVKEGDKVMRGTILLIVEAMKMENNIVAPHDAIIEKIAVKEGDMVDSDVQLVVLEEIQ